MEIQSLFPVGILTHRVPLEVSNKIEKLVTSRLKKLKNLGHCYSDYFTDRIFSLKEIQCLVDEINKCQLFYSQKVKTPSAIIQNYWVQDYQTFQFHERHNHGKTQYSVVYWVRANQNSGDLVLYNPNPFITLWSEKESTNNNSSFISEEYRIPPIKGGLVIFPGYLDHKVLSGKEGCIRTTIAFNLVIK